MEQGLLLRLLLRLLKGSLYAIGAQATAAHRHSLGCSINYGSDTLYVRFPFALGLDVGVADSIAVNNALTTNLAIVSHGETPFLCNTAILSQPPAGGKVKTPVAVLHLPAKCAYTNGTILVAKHEGASDKNAGSSPDQARGGIRIDPPIHLQLGRAMVRCQ